MTAEARALAQALLNHHRQMCRGRTSGQRSTDLCVIPYGLLCEQADVSYLTHRVGQFLREVAKWCQANDWPPINALAVNKDTRMPGEGYDGAPGCNLLQWPEAVTACIEFDGYPEVVS